VLFEGGKGIDHDQVAVEFLHFGPGQVGQLHGSVFGS
jgi:hypothetical protein